MVVLANQGRRTARMAKKKLKIEFGAITNSNIEQVRLARLMGHCRFGL
jgi:hypothetical protein